MKLSLFLKIVLLILFFFLLFLYTRGLNPANEGLLLQSARYINQGEIVYKNFYFPHTPGSIFVIALLFKFFGQTILTARLLIFFSNFISIILIFQISKTVTKRTEYGIISGLIFVVYESTRSNYISIGSLSLFVVILTLFIATRSIYRPRNEKKEILLGVLSFFCFLSFQNLLFIVLPILISQLLKKGDKINSFITTLYGYLWSAILFSVYLLSTDSFKDFVDKIILQNTFKVNIIYFGNWQIFTIILISLVSVAILLYRKKYHLIFLPLTILVYSISSGISQNYFLQLLAIAGIPLSLIMNNFPKVTIKGFGYSIFLVLIVLGITNFIDNLHSPNSLLQKKYLLKSGANIYVGRDEYNEYRELISLTEKFTKNDETIYFEENEFLNYFILNRSPLINYQYSFNNKVYQDKTTRSLVAKKPRIVIIARYQKIEEIHKYVIANYLEIGQTQNYRIYKIDK